MKKTFLILSLLASTIAFSQKAQFGIKGGANISNFSGGNFDAVKKKALVGFHAGGYLNFSFLNVAIQPELMVSTQGAKIDSVSGSYNWKLTYITLPAMFQVKVGPGFYFEAGPQVGVVINDNLGNKSFNDLDLSVAGGLGFRGLGGFGLGARYTAGLSKVGDFDPSTNINPDFKNGVLQVSLYIPLTK